MSQQNLMLPLSIIGDLISNEGEVITPEYLGGQPRPYVLDMSKGKLIFNGEDLTTAGQSFQLQPLAIRVSKGELFGKEERKYCEIYFLNQHLHLCCFLIHSFSVDELSRVFAPIKKYDKRKIYNCKMTVHMNERTNKQSGNRYYIASFHLRPNTASDNITVQQVISNTRAKYVHIYRDNMTASKSCYKENYSHSGEMDEQARIDDRNWKKSVIANVLV